MSTGINYKIAPLVLVGAAVLAFAGCSAYVRLNNVDPKNYNDSKNATISFHDLFDSGQYTVIYNSAAEGFHEVGSRDLLVAYLGRLNRKMGRCGEGSPVTVTDFRVTKSGTFIATTSSRICSNGKLDEQFVWVMVSDRATLFRYQANSPLLLTD